MNVELFLARRLLKGDAEKSVSVPIVKIAVVGIALGLCVMLLAVFILTGFKHEITRKLSGFTAHLNILPYESYLPDDLPVVDNSEELVRFVRNIDGVKQAYAYVERPAIFKRQEEIHGVVVKGMDTTYDPAFFREHLKEGVWPDYTTDTISNDILISSLAAAYLKVGTGDRIDAFFVGNGRTLTRRFQVKGIYDTGFKEYDDLMVLADIRRLIGVNKWEKGYATGVAVELEDVNALNQVTAVVRHKFEEAGYDYDVKTLGDVAPQIFDWLKLINMNVWVILILIVLVAGFNMVSGLLILILDKAGLIGLMKAFGYRNISLRRLFLYISSGLIVRGMIWGNLVAFLLAGLQYAFHIIKLDPVSYYMSTVPIHFNLLYIVLLNIGVILATVLMLIVPTMLISRIDPIKTIKFD